MSAMFKNLTDESHDFVRLSADFALPSAIAWQILNRTPEQIAAAANGLQSTGTAAGMALELEDAVNRARGLLALLEAGERRLLDALATAEPRER
jgi:hypothetical protein